MKRHIFLILITLLLIATALKAGAEASKDENLSRYLGAWVSEEYRLYIRIEDDEVIARLTEVNGDYVWEFNRCFFDRDEGCLCGRKGSRIRLRRKSSRSISARWRILTRVISAVLCGRRERPSLCGIA